MSTSTPRSSGWNNLTIGTNALGVSSGAIDGVYVGPATTSTSNPASSRVQLNFVTIEAVVNGIHVDGGVVSVLQEQTLTIKNVSGDGVLCRSDTAPALQSGLDPKELSFSVIVQGAKNHDIFASTNCTGGLLSCQLGQAVPCPSSKVDEFGVYIGVEREPQLAGRSCLLHEPGRHQPEEQSKPQRQ